MSLKNILQIGCLTIIGIGGLAYMALTFDYPLLITSFGATAVLIYGVPESPLAHPKNVLGGHLLSACIGVICYTILGYTWYSIAIAVALAIIGMKQTNTTHPPGGATAIVAIQSQASWTFILMPVLVGVIFLLLVAQQVKLFTALNNKSNQ